MNYIQVIVPLKVEWEPWYSALEELQVGTRVRVRLGGHEYVAVVSSTGGTPDMDLSRILPIMQVERHLTPIAAEEIRFWRFVADYYLCSIGEVYKAAYPVGRTMAEGRDARGGSSSHQEDGTRRKGLSPGQKETIIRILDGWDEHKPVLLHATEREAIYAELTGRCLSGGKDVLLLRVDSRKPGHVWQREMSKSLRSNVPTLVEGHRSNIFLPFHKLGLVIVDDEESPSYKQESTAPRYQARDAAIALAAMHGADVLLGSKSPSLESMYNALCGKYLRIGNCPPPNGTIPEIIDTVAETRKRGMRERLSLKMLEAVREAQSDKRKVLVLSPWKDFKETEYQFRQQIRDNRFAFASIADAIRGTSRLKLGKYHVIVLMHADALLGGGDFRADEKAFRILREISEACPERLIIQTRSADHPIFKAMAAAVPDISSQLLEERIRFGYPPVTRLVAIRIEDKNAARLAKMGAELSRQLGGLQFFLPKDHTLATRKKEIADKVREFESSHRYRGHITIDVDP